MSAARGLLILITAPHFCAGALFSRRGEGYVCTEAAPIIKYMVGWTNARTKEYAKSKGWQLEVIK